MSARMSRVHLLVLLCLLPLLLAQALGVHHHRHLDDDGARHPPHLALDESRHHGAVHLADTGLHVLTAGADVAHGDTADDPTHLHFDLERPTVAKGLMKALLDLPTIALVIVLMLLPLGSGLVLRRHTPRRPAKRRPPRYLLTPPALAPPR